MKGNKEECEKESELFNVQINDIMYSIHYVAEQVPLKEAVKVAKKYVEEYNLCPRSVFIEKVFMEGKTQVHESTSYYDLFIRKPVKVEA